MKILISTPCYGGLVAERYMASVIGMLAHRAWSVPGVRFQRATVSGEALIPYARNSLAASFLQSECDAMLCIDADTEFAPSDVDALLSANKPLVGGACPLKTPTPEFNVFGVEDVRGELARVRGVGLGFALIRRDVFERMAPTVPRYRVEDGEAADFFAPEISYGRYFSEDLSFCNRWRRLGGEVWAHLGVQLGHVGNHTFRGDPRGLLQG